MRPPGAVTGRLAALAAAWTAVPSRLSPFLNRDWIYALAYWFAGLSEVHGPSVSGG